MRIGGDATTRPGLAVGEGDDIGVAVAADAQGVADEVPVKLLASGNQSGVIGGGFLK